MPPKRQPPPASWSVFSQDPTNTTNSSNNNSNDPRPSITFEAQQSQRRPTVPSALQNNPTTSSSNLLLHTSDSTSSNPKPNADDQTLRHRRSSLGQRVEALRAAGGANSLDNFARSWQRAAGFYEIATSRPSFRFEEQQQQQQLGHDEEAGGGHVSVGEGRGEGSQQQQHSPVVQRSLLRQQLESGERTPGEEHALEVDDEQEEEEEEEEEEEGGGSGAGLFRTTSGNAAPSAAGEQQPLLPQRRLTGHEDNIFNIEPSLASPFGGSYGSTWGSLASRVNEPSMRHAGRLFREQQMKGVVTADKEREPLLVRQVQEDDGKVVNVVVGQSTLPQTIFNSVNVLVGVGLLSLPLAIRYAGWIPGILFLIFCAVSTSYTAKILAKCADVDSSLITFADLAYVSFGHSARIATSILFSLELIGACMALIVLFADSLDALIPGWGLIEWKIVCGIILLPLAFVPLRYLSFTSILGILCCFSIVLAVFVDGLVKPHQPGSLRSPAQTHLFPANWATLPISFGLLISPWGGHSVFPNIYRDMRHPYKYRRAVNVTYIFTFLLDTLLAIIGYVMFGDTVRDEVTKNIVDKANAFPRWISIFVIVCVAIIPLTKVPLNGRPIIATIEIPLGLDNRALGASTSLTGLSGFTRGVLRFTVRVLCTVVFVVLAILIPDFDRIMSLIGSVACFSICIVLPCGFHLRLFGKELSVWQKAVDWGLIVVSSLLAVVSTAFNFVPKDKLGL